MKEIKLLTGLSSVLVESTTNGVYGKVFFKLEIMVHGYLRSTIVNDIVAELSRRWYWNRRWE